MTDIKQLLDIGFVNIGQWFLQSNDIYYRIKDEADAKLESLLSAPNALYVFSCEGEVLYIGKTVRSVRKRLNDYRRPAKSQKTNWRCNQEIRNACAAGQVINILALVPDERLQHEQVMINLAAGLEDPLIKLFNPLWNFHGREKPIAHSVQQVPSERVDISLPGLPQNTDDQRENTKARVVHFWIRLGDAYYNQGIVNPGVNSSAYLGEHGSRLELNFTDGTAPVITTINRRANRNGSVRFVGGNRKIADWFQSHFSRGDEVEAAILTPYKVQFLRSLTRV